MKKEIATDKPTVHKIMDAAIPLFAKRGFAAVSVKELAEAAGVNIALISYYFGGKENLYATILETQFGLIDNIINAISNQRLSPIERIRCFAKEIVNLHKQCPYVHHLIYGEIINPTACYESIVKPGIVRSHDFLDECIREAMNAGQFRPDLKPDCANILLGSLIHFYFFTTHVADMFLDQKSDQAEYYIAEALDMYLKGVLNNPVIKETK